jgi:hypothetical protein
MLKRMLWVVPLLLALTSAAVDAQTANPHRRRRGEHAPEFDPKAAGAAIAFLIGGTLLLSERRRRNTPESE